MLKLMFRVFAIAAGLTWAVLAWRAAAGPEALSARDGRTAAFVVAFGLGMLGWPAPKPPKKGSRYKERL